MRDYKALAILFLLLFASACSLFGPRMSEEDCRIANWGEYGMTDAAAGVTKIEGRAYYQEHCISKHNVTVDWKTYDLGYARGLKSYCTEQKGYQVGANGGSYAGICDEKGAALFYEGYRRGYLDYLNQEIENVDSEIITREAKKDRMLLDLDRLQYDADPNKKSQRHTLQTDIGREIDTIASLKIKRLKLQSEKNQ